MADTSSIICRDVRKSFGDPQNTLWALRGVTMEIASNQMTLLVGPSGCGKTTLISIIAGLLDVTSGSLQVLGQEFSAFTPEARVNFRRQRMGFIFQQYNLLPALTAAENAAIPLIASGMNRTDAAARARTLLESLGLQGRTEAYPRQLSGGQQQRVSIARALIHDPDLLLCDEPTAALDHESGHQVMELLSQTAKREGRAVVVVTHDNRIFNFADRIIAMDDGQLVEAHR